MGRAFLTGIKKQETIDQIISILKQ
jgi:hypothetical protein